MPARNRRRTPLGTTPPVAPTDEVETAIAKPIRPMIEPSAEPTERAADPDQETSVIAPVLDEDWLDRLDLSAD